MRRPLGKTTHTSSLIWASRGRRCVWSTFLSHENLHATIPMAPGAVRIAVFFVLFCFALLCLVLLACLLNCLFSYIKELCYRFERNKKVACSAYGRAVRRMSKIILSEIISHSCHRISSRTSDRVDSLSHSSKESNYYCPIAHQPILMFSYVHHHGLTRAYNLWVRVAI